MLFTKEGLEKLREKRVAIFGLGGVGGYVLEALVRSGIENFDLIAFIQNLKTIMIR
jgi:tRNA A37 threonylcarbamoyladenosine dehydratase